MGRGASAERPNEMDAFDRLRAANPVDPDALPNTDSPHARALYEELAMSTTSSTPPLRRLALAAALASVLALAVVGLLVIADSGRNGSRDPAPIASGDPTTSTDPVSPPGMATCVETYSLDTLANREIAFDGTLTKTDGDRVTFAVNEVFTGDVDDTETLGGGTVVTADAPPSSASGPGLQVGDRALVAGSDGFAWGCGFTQPHNPDVADQWRETFD